MPHITVIFMFFHSASTFAVSQSLVSSYFSTIHLLHAFATSLFLSLSTLITDIPPLLSLHSFLYSQFHLQQEITWYAIPAPICTVTTMTFPICCLSTTTKWIKHLISLLSYLQVYLFIRFIKHVQYHNLPSPLLAHILPKHSPFSSTPDTPKVQNH